MTLQLSRVVRKPVFRSSDQVWHKPGCTASQKMARGLKFRIKKVDGLYYLCSENNVADHLQDYKTADLRLCFRICKKTAGSIIAKSSHKSSLIFWCQITLLLMLEHLRIEQSLWAVWSGSALFAKTCLSTTLLSSFCSWANWSMSSLIGQTGTGYNTNFP